MVYIALQDYGLHPQVSRAEELIYLGSIIINKHVKKYDEKEKEKEDEVMLKTYRI